MLDSISKRRVRLKKLNPLQSHPKKKLKGKEVFIQMHCISVMLMIWENWIV